MKAHNTLEYIKGLRANLEQKKAEIVGDNPATMPGSEHDKAIPAGAKEPDKETKDQTMVPNSGLTTSGAGDDSPITHKNDLTAEQAALTPKKEPEVTGDAEAQVPGGKSAEEKTAEQLGAEILEGITAWEQKQAEAAKAAEAGKEPEKQAGATEGPSSGAGTGEALITDTGKNPEQTGAVKGPEKKDMETADAMKPATGEGASGETAAAAKAAETGKEGEAAKAAETGKEAECCKDGKCGKCSKCKAAAEAAKKAPEAKKAGALDMELTQDVLAKIAAVMLATEEGTKLAEATLAKAAGAEAAEKTISFLRTQNELAQKQAEYQAGQRDALMAILKQAQEAAPAVGGDNGVAEIANELDAMVQAGEITEDEADQVVVQLAQALGGDAAPAAVPAAGGDAKPEGDNQEGGKAEEKKEAQEAPAAGGDAAINAAVAPAPENLDTSSLPQEGLDDITPEEVAGAIDSLVQSGEITEDEADQLVQEIAGDGGAAGAGAEGDISPEEIATVLQEAVQSGELKPEDVQQVLTELEGVPAPDAGAAAAPADAGAAAQAAGGAAAAPETAVTPADEAKEAEAAKAAPVQKTAGMKVLEAIKAAREQKKAEAAKAAATK